jgi:hypothetical protein
MVDTARRVHYFSTQVPDRPGAAFKVLATLVSSGVNLLACSGTQRGGQALIHVVPDDAAGFADVARAAGLDFEPQKSGFLIQGDDRPGALAENLKKLADAHINVSAIDAVVAGAGRWAAIVWVDPVDVSNAAGVLGVAG